MQISISTRHGQLSETSREKIQAKVEKLTRIFDRLTSIEVTIDLEHEDTPTVDIRVSAEHKHDFVATERSSSFWGSVDLALHKMEQQLRKYKDKVQRRRGPRKDEMIPESESPDAEYPETENVE